MRISYHTADDGVRMSSYVAILWGVGHHVAAVTAVGGGRGLKRIPSLAHQYFQSAQLQEALEDERFKMSAQRETALLLEPEK